MKELRREHHRHNQRVQDSGGPVVVGIAEQFLALLAGLGDYATWQYEPRFTACMRNHEEAATNFEALEAHGYGRDLCNSLRLHMGGILRGHLAEALKGKKPDFVFQFEICPFSIKTALFAGEQLGVPVLTLDTIGRYRPGPIDTAYIVDQLQELIGQMEKITGRPYDDERLIEATRNEWDCSVLWAEICDLTKHVPTPIDYRHMQSLRIPVIVDRDKPQIVTFYREVLDEVKDRVAKGISARGFEEARLLYEGFMPFHNVGMLRWPERYGAIFVGGGFCFTSFGSWRLDDEGRWTPAKRWVDRGLPLRTREDALRALVDLYMGNDTERRPFANILYIRTRPEEQMWRVKDWRAQGVVMGVERRCRVQFLVQAEQITVMQQNGVPCVEFDPSSADPREFDEVQAYGRVSALLEGMGLHKTEIAEADIQDD